jgi:hypothetical protein
MHTCQPQRLATVMPVNSEGDRAPCTLWPEPRQ